MMNRKELAQLMGDAPALNAIGNNRAAYMRDVATRDDLLQALTDGSRPNERRARGNGSNPAHA